MMQEWYAKLGSNVIQPLKEWFDKLNQRDQYVVMLLAVFLGAMLVYLLLWQPVQKALKSHLMAYHTKADLYAWIKQREPEVKKIQAAMAKKNKPNRGQSILSTVSNVAKQQNIVFKRYEPDGDSGIRVWMEQQSFNNIILWLDTLSKEYGLQVINISLDKQSSGVVDAKIVLER